MPKRSNAEQSTEITAAAAAEREACARVACKKCSAAIRARGTNGQEATEAEATTRVLDGAILTREADIV